MARQIQASFPFRCCFRAQLARDSLPLTTVRCGADRDSAYIFAGNLDYEFSEGDIIVIFSQ